MAKKQTTAVRSVPIKKAMMTFRYPLLKSNGCSALKGTTWEKSTFLPYYILHKLNVFLCKNNKNNCCGQKLFIWKHIPYFLELLWIVNFSLASSFPLLLTHSRVMLPCFSTFRLTVLLTVSFDTAVMTEYSVLFLRGNHWMVGKGNPSMIHTQVKTCDWSTHPEPFWIFDSPVKRNARS